MAEEPLIRASLPKSSWAEIVRAPADDKQRIIAVLGPAFEAELNAATTVTWVPFALEARIADAVFQALGPTKTRAFYRAKTERSFDIPFLKPLITSSLRLFGASPNSMLKMVPKTWTTLSRNCGRYEWTDEGQPRRGVVNIHDFPTRFYRQRDAWLDSCYGGYEAFFMPFRLMGTVSIGEVDFPRGHAQFILTW
jgi:hypothetical protein